VSPPPPASLAAGSRKARIALGLVLASAVAAVLYARRHAGACGSLDAANVTVDCVSDPRFRESARRAPDAQRTKLVLAAVDLLEGELDKNDLAQLEQLCEFISVLDRPSNGHARYYRGEIAWRSGKRNQLRDHLGRYVDVARSEAETERCVGTVRGYCKQRTEWVWNLLANDYFNEAKEERDASKKNGALAQAHQFAAAVLARRPDGFPQGVTVLSTTEIELLSRPTSVWPQR
jgi:hypothetical protein